MAESGYILVTIVYLRNYHALVSFAVATIIFLCTYLIYISICLFTYVLDLTCYYYYYHYYF